MTTLSQIKAGLTTANDRAIHPYECYTCGARFDCQRQVCPECGGHTLDRIDWPSNC